MTIIAGAMGRAAAAYVGADGASELATYGLEKGKPLVVPVK